jgi:hypothetical protein
MLLLIEQFNQPPLYFLAIPNPPAGRYLLKIWGRSTYSDPNSFKWLRLSLLEFNLDIDICTAGERIEHR